MDSAGRLATERRNVEQMRARLPAIEGYLPLLLKRIAAFAPVPAAACVLDVGAAQGLHVIALRRRGMDAIGLEPWEAAIEAGRGIALEMGMEPSLFQGTAERMPFEDASFDLVLAFYVMEHVESPEAVFAEVHRVLRPGGCFFFATNSALCPRQHEIRGFPLFPWYPRRLKRRVMDWTLEHRPHLIGDTATPAYHWYTPWGVRREMARLGFSRTVDRWELRRDDESSGWRGAALSLAKRSRAVRVVADVAVPECSYLVIK